MMFRIFRLLAVVILLPWGCSRPSPFIQSDSAVKNSCIFGGPFVILPQSVASKWRGGNLALYSGLPENEPTDYGRVVAVTQTGRAGLVTAADEQGLALGAGRMILWPKTQSADQIVFVCLDVCSPDAKLDELVDRAMQAPQGAMTSEEWTITSNELVFLNANATIDNSIFGTVSFTVTPGKYIVTERKQTASDTSEVARIIEIKHSISSPNAFGPATPSSWEAKP